MGCGWKRCWHCLLTWGAHGVKVWASGWVGQMCLGQCAMRSFALLSDQPWSSVSRMVCMLTEHAHHLGYMLTEHVRDATSISRHRTC
eukprot:291913-Alexandrium_andersonii.AAC.2